jgi:hypothetical protein
MGLPTTHPVLMTKQLLQIVELLLRELWCPTICTCLKWCMDAHTSA